jgi:hypothetical protein
MLPVLPIGHAHFTWGETGGKWTKIKALGHQPEENSIRSSYLEA